MQAAKKVASGQGCFPTRRIASGQRQARYSPNTSSNLAACYQLVTYDNPAVGPMAKSISSLPCEARDKGRKKALRVLWVHVCDVVRTDDQQP